MALAARKSVKQQEETNVEPKVEETQAPATVTTETVAPEAPVEEPKVEVSAPAVVDKHAEERTKFATMTTTEVWNHFGGQEGRGNVSKAIRYLTAIGFDKASVAKLTGKRYQHVRNVLVEDARQKLEAEARQKAKAQTQTA